MEKGLTEVCASGNVCTAATDTESHSFDTKSTIKSGTKQDGNSPVNGVFAKWIRNFVRIQNVSIIKLRQ